MLAPEVFGEYQVAGWLVMGAVVILVGIVVTVLFYTNPKTG
jgi:hypothetical protein